MSSTNRSHLPGAPDDRRCLRPSDGNWSRPVTARLILLASLRSLLVVAGFTLNMPSTPVLRHKVEAAVALLLLLEPGINSTRCLIMHQQQRPRATTHTTTTTRLLPAPTAAAAKPRSLLRITLLPALRTPHCPRSLRTARWASSSTRSTCSLHRGCCPHAGCMKSAMPCRRDSRTCSGGCCLQATSTGSASAPCTDTWRTAAPAREHVCCLRRLSSLSPVRRRHLRFHCILLQLPHQRLHLRLNNSNNNRVPLSLAPFSVICPVSNMAQHISTAARKHSSSHSMTIIKQEKTKKRTVTTVTMTEETFLHIHRRRLFLSCNSIIDINTFVVSAAARLTQCRVRLANNAERCACTDGGSGGRRALSILSSPPPRRSASAAARTALRSTSTRICSAGHQVRRALRSATAASWRARRAAGYATQSSVCCGCSSLRWMIATLLSIRAGTTS